MFDRKNFYQSSKKIGEAFIAGASIMLPSAPIVNAFNRASVVACRYNLSELVAYKSIYQGKIDSCKPSILNFGVGMGGHLGKEFPRLLFKSTGLYLYKPWLNTQYTPARADLIFAATLSVSEILINPADTWRVNIQAGDKLERSLRRLYAGSCANGLRQFGSWWGFGFSNRMLNAGLSKYTHIDPHSLQGIVVKAYPQSLFFTTQVYLIERIKNELQYQSSLPSTQKPNYVNSAKNIVSKQGLQGFFRGFHPKVLSNAVLTVGANILIEQGKKNLKK